MARGQKRVLAERLRESLESNIKTALGSSLQRFNPFGVDRFLDINHGFRFAAPPVATQIQALRACVPALLGCDGVATFWSMKAVRFLSEVHILYHFHRAEYRQHTYFDLRIHAMIASRSAFGTSECAGMGIVPHTPVLPFFTCMTR